MLGAIVLFLQILLYGYCWSLNKKIAALKKTESSIPIGKFIWCSIINFIVLVPIVSVIMCLFLLMFGLEKKTGEDGFMVIALLLSIIFVCCIIAHHYSRNKHLLSETKLVYTITDSYKGIIQNVETAIVKPNSFIESYLFKDFVIKYGPNVGKVSHTNKQNGKVFYTLEVRDSTGKTVSIRFHPSLGELSPEQLKERRDELFVGKKASNHRWYLYDKNFKENKAWEEVDLGI